MGQSSQELILNSKSFLVSETDEKWIIKFANDEFCKYAEYSLEELVGQPHSVVRHEDMPKVAFKELWDTVKRGVKWRGFVKNKTKSGKYYWVFATVFPFTASDGSKGFLSCRRKASRAEVEKYSKLYEQIIKEQ